MCRWPAFATGAASRLRCTHAPCLPAALPDISESMGGAVAAQHVGLPSSTLTHERQARLGQSPRRDPAWPFTTDHAVACVLHVVTCVALCVLRAGCCTLRAASCSRITSVVVIWSLMNDRSFSTVAKLSFAVVIFLFSSAFASSNGYSSICAQTNKQPTNRALLCCAAVLVQLSLSVSDRSREIPAARDRRYRFVRDMGSPRWLRARGQRQ